MFDEYTQRVLEHVKNLRGEWYLTSGWLRRGSINYAGNCCPVSSLKDWPPDEYVAAAAQYGIPERTARQIAAAADNRCDSGHPLRAALLEAAGLSEKEER